MNVDPLVWGAAGVAALLLVRRVIGGKRVSENVVREKIAAGATIVDVRTPEEFAGGAYPGAKNIPVQVLGARMNEIPKGKPVVVYCASGGRSAVAQTMLARAGYDAVNAGGLGSMPR